MCQCLMAWGSGLTTMERSTSIMRLYPGRAGGDATLEVHYHATTLRRAVCSMYQKFFPVFPGSWSSPASQWTVAWFSAPAKRLPQRLQGPLIMNHSQGRGPLWVWGTGAVSEIWYLLQYSQVHACTLKSMYRPMGLRLGFPVHHIRVQDTWEY